MDLATLKTDVPIRDAATIILVRDAETVPKVLMGQRGKTAAFMPDRYVFPGGAVDAGDADVAVTGLGATCENRLMQVTDGGDPNRFVATAIRELWEETGQALSLIHISEPTRPY